MIGQVWDNYAKFLCKKLGEFYPIVRHFEKSVQNNQWLTLSVCSVKKLHDLRIEKGLSAAKQQEILHLPDSPFVLVIKRINRVIERQVLVRML